MAIKSLFAALCALSLLTLTAQVQAGWGRYRITTYYGTPSVPAYYGAETLVVRSVRRPVVVAPAVVAPAPVVGVYSTPALYVPALPVQPPVRAYYAPGPGTIIYGPAPATYYYPGTVILP